MKVQILSLEKSVVFRNPGKESAQILCQDNSPDARATITRVTMKQGAVSARHSHPNSEQTWLIEAGRGMLLLEGDQSIPVAAGEIVRTPPRVIHGIENTGEDVLVYLAITTPPEDMGNYYDGVVVPT